MGAPRIVIGERNAELGVLERVVRQLGYEPLRPRRGMHGDPPRVDAVLLERSYELGRELVRSLRQRNPALRVVYLDRPFSLDSLRTRLERAVAGPSPGRVLVSLSRR